MTAGLPHGARFTIVLPASPAGPASTSADASISATTSSEAAAPAAEDTIEREF
jgi:hypothetical protein